jgi:quercetin dioxygenase-like cupin family protein
MSNQQTYFGSLENYRKGGVETIDDNPKNYAFSNVFEVASKSKPYEKVAVGKNLKYVIEALRAEGTSPWFAAAHDEAALVMDGELEVHYVKPDQAPVSAGKEGTVKLASEPAGKKMGWVKVRRGHMALLPAGAAYQFRNAGKPGVLLVQTILGENTVQKWAEICQTK